MVVLRNDPLFYLLYFEAHGSRSCNRTDENEGEWGQANIDDCISMSLRQLKYKVCLVLKNISHNYEN